MPELSVVVPVYNMGSALQYSIKSILNQTYRDFELILVDDGSADESGKICDSFAQKDKRVRVIHKENGGAGSARNLGINESSGEYIAFPDADDVCKPNMFKIMMDKMHETDVDLVMCSYETVSIDQYGNISDRNPQNIFDAAAFSQQEARELWFEIRNKNIAILNSPCNKIYKHKTIAENELSFPNIRRAQDAVFNLHYYDKISSCILINKPLYCYRVNDNILVGKKFPRDVYNCFILLDKSMVEVISSWNMYYGEYKALCDNHLMGIIDECVNLCNNPVWNLSKEEKMGYLNNLCADEYLQGKINNYEGYVYEIEDLIEPIKKKNPKLILKILNHRKKIERFKNSAIGKLLRKIKAVFI